MKIFLLILLCFLSFSCGKSNENKADDTEGKTKSDEAVCAENHAECGDLRIVGEENIIRVFCGECKKGLECDEYEHKCKIVTREADCRGKPEHGVWNDNGAEGIFTQTWDGENWIPKNKDAVYSETPVECGFVCPEEYYWNNFYCIDRPTRKKDCPALPANAVWNDNGADGTFIQTWDGENWVPESVEAVPGKTPGDCVFMCKEGYAWKNGGCITAPTRTEPCKGLPEHASWNTADSVFQTSDGFDWTPTDEGVYDETPSSEACRFVCNSSYFWNGEKCVNPCETNNPCPGIENSDGICVPARFNLIICGCSEGYRWNSKEKQCESNENAGKVVCTGQTDCYIDNAERPCDEAQDDYFGQDAQYAGKGMCIPRNLSVENTEIEGEGIVTDHNTGLEWQQTIPNTHDFTWEKAVDYCEKLGYGGHDDWRLPTIYELRTILDYGEGGIDKTLFPGPTYYFWTTTVDAVYGDGGHWVVNFGQGGAYSNNANYFEYCVRCVRKNWSAPVSKFKKSIENGDIIVKDSTTGLIWQGTVEDKDLTWDEALVYCENLIYAGYNDWRLPNVNELETLLDFEESEEPFSAFPDIPGWRFWSSTSSSSGPSKALHLNLEYGSVNPWDKSVKYLAVCVR